MIQIKCLMAASDKKAAKFALAERDASGYAKYAAFTINAHAQSMMRNGFQGVDAFPSQGYAVVQGKDNPRIVCILDDFGDYFVLTFSGDDPRKKNEDQENRV